MAILNYLRYKQIINMKFMQADDNFVVYFFLFWYPIVLIAACHMRSDVEFSVCAVMFSSKEFLVMERF